MRRGIFASQTSRAERGEFGNTSARSNLGLATEAAEDSTRQPIRFGPNDPSVEIDLQLVCAEGAVCDTTRPPIDPERGELTLKVRRQLVCPTQSYEGDRVLVSVADTGTGIAPQDADRIFNPLFTTKSDGMGMGLSICRSIIEAHEGRLWVAANTPHGSVFHFILPTDTALSAGRHDEGDPATSRPPA